MESPKSKKPRRELLFPHAPLLVLPSPSDFQEDNCDFRRSTIREIKLIEVSRIRASVAEQFVDLELLDGKHHFGAKARGLNILRRLLDLRELQDLEDWSDFFLGGLRYLILQMEQ